GVTGHLVVVRAAVDVVIAGLGAVVLRLVVGVGRGVVVGDLQGFAGDYVLAATGVDVVVACTAAGVGGVVRHRRAAVVDQRGGLAGDDVGAFADLEAVVAGHATRGRQVVGQGMTLEALDQGITGHSVVTRLALERVA